MCIRDSHTVISKIGAGLPPGTLFKNRRPTKIIVKPLPQDKYDYITSRIIRLSGLEDDINKGGNVDTFNRYIYIVRPMKCFSSKRRHDRKNRS